MTTSRKDLVSGLFFVACGAFFCVRTLTDLPLGTALRMGPGYFPLMLGIILVLLGGAIVVKSFGMADAPLGAVSWRAIGLVIAAPLIFAFTVRGLGFAPAMVFSVVVAAFASRRMSLGFALVLAIVLSIFCTLVFKFGLRLPLRTFGPWLSG